MIELKSVGLKFGLATNSESQYVSGSANPQLRSSIMSAIKESIGFWGYDYSEPMPFVVPSQLLTPWQIIGLNSTGYDVAYTNTTDQYPFVVPLSAIQSSRDMIEWHKIFVADRTADTINTIGSTTFYPDDGRIVYSGQSALSANDGFVGEGLYCVVIPGFAIEKFQHDLDSTTLTYIVSEPFSFSTNTQDYTTFLFKNEKTDLYVAGKYKIDFTGNFFFKMLLASQIGRPNYEFEESISERLGYKFVESQTSKKTYKIAFPANESMCDNLRIAKLCQQRQMRCNDKYYDIIAMDMSVEWLEQGDVAGVTLTIEVDNIINTTGEYVNTTSIGDFDEDDFNNDYDDVENSGIIVIPDNADEADERYKLEYFVPDDYVESKKCKIDISFPDGLDTAQNIGSILVRVIAAIDNRSGWNGSYVIYESTQSLSEGTTITIPDTSLTHPYGESHVAYPYYYSILVYHKNGQRIEPKFTFTDF